MYKELKSNFEFTSYIDTVKWFNLRKYITKLRLSSHMLKIETGRYTNIPRHERKCEFCTKNDIEDEFHFVLICPLYNDLRYVYIHKYYHVRPSVQKLISLLNNENQKVLLKLALYCKNAFARRLDPINSNN